MSDLESQTRRYAADQSTSPAAASSAGSATVPLRSRLLRLGRYASWTIVDELVFLGVPRLVLWPILAAMLGDAVFGSFILALGFVRIIGFAPSNGLAAYYIRDAAKYSHVDQQVLMRTVLFLCLVVSAAIVVCFTLCARTVAGWYSDPRLVWLLPSLGIYLGLTNLVNTWITVYKYRRSFGYIALIHSVEAAFLFLAIPLYRLQGLAGVGHAFVAAGLASLVVLLLIERRVLGGRPACAIEFVKGAMRVWLPMSGSALIYFSTGYLDRLLLGYWWPSDDVAVFFAAAGTAHILIVPSTQASNLLLSLLTRIRDANQFDRRFYGLYASGVGLLAVVVFFVGNALGDVVLSSLYPSLKERALPLWGYATASVAALTIMVGCRPFVVKFLPANWIPILVTIAAVGKIVPILILVPTGGRVGAAQAMLVGAVISALAWFAVYFICFVYGGANAAGAEDRATGRDRPDIENVEAP